MKALVLHGPGDLRLEDAPKPKAQAGAVVVRVEAAPVWDYVAEVVAGSRNYPLSYPLIFGTCCVGRVEEAGPDVTSLEAGQLVFCDYIVRLRDAPGKRIVLGYFGGQHPEELKLSSGHWKNGCFAEYAAFPSENIHPIQETVIQQRGITTGQLAEIASIMPGMGAANAINIKPGESVLVLPATGFFSSSAVAAVLGLGANPIVGSRSQEKLDAMVKQFGPDEKRIKPVLLTGDVEKDVGALLAATPGGKGADAYIEYSPPMAAKSNHITAGLLSLKEYGRCCFAGVILDNVALPYAVIMSRCLTIKGQFAQSREDVAQTIRLIEIGNVKPIKNISGQFKLEEHAQALKLASESKGWGSMVVLTP